MRKSAAALGTSIFFALAPGIVAGVVPWRITRWQMRAAPALAMPARVSGAVLIAVGAVVLVSAFVRFVQEGRGTPAPIAPTEHLVIGGLYRFVRNPMYVAVLAVIWGQALLLWQAPLLWYGGIAAVAFVSFVKGYEEPTLARRFGAEYEAYRRAVPGWVPRLWR